MKKSDLMSAAASRYFGDDDRAVHAGGLSVKERSREQPGASALSPLAWRHTLVVRGELDDGLTSELEEELECLCEEGVTSVVLDVRELRVLDPHGAQAIAAGGQLCRSRGRDVHVIPGSPDAEQLLSRAGAGDMLVRQWSDGLASPTAGADALRTTTVRDL